MRLCTVCWVGMWNSYAPAHFILNSYVKQFCAFALDVGQLYDVVILLCTWYWLAMWKIYARLYFGGTQWRSWLRHCGTSWNVAVSITDGASGIFHWHNSFGLTIVLGLTQPLIEISNRNIFFGGKGGQCLGLTTLPPSYAGCLEIWEPQTPGTLRACPGLHKDCFTKYMLFSGWLAVILEFFYKFLTQELS